MPGIFSRVIERMSTEKQEAGDLRDDAARAGCLPIDEQGERSRVHIHGVLRSVTLRPVDGVTALEAELYDGSDAVTLVWLGRRRIEGIAVGRRLTATGRLGRRGSERVLYNPRYVLEA